MKPYLFAAGVVGVLAGGPLAAQVPTAHRPLPPEALTGGEACAQARQHPSLRVATASVSHRAKMNRYDVKYYKLDLALEKQHPGRGRLGMDARAGRVPGPRFAGL